MDVSRNRMSRDDVLPTKPSPISPAPISSDTIFARSWMEGDRKVHPLLTALIPEVSPQQLTAMIDQARRTGRSPGPAILWRGFLVDGRARVACALKLRLPIEVIDVSHLQETSLPDFILETNLYRRHLTAGQRALIAIEASSRAAKLGLKHITRERAAAAAGISPASLFALQYALGITPQLIAPVRAGIISINRATEACRVMIDWSPERCDALVERLMTLDSTAAAELIRSLRAHQPSYRPTASGPPPASVARKTQASTPNDSHPAPPIVADHLQPSAAIAVDAARPVSRDMRSADADPDLALHVSSLLASLRDLARHYAVLRQATTLAPEPHASAEATDLLAAIRTVIALDWHTLQHNLAALADRLATPVASSPPGATMEEETRHGS